MKLSESNYDDLRKEILFIKKILRIQELKWYCFKKKYKDLNSKGKLEGLKNIHYEIFITITDTKHFKKKNYRIFSKLYETDIFSNLPESVDKEKLKKRVENTIRREYFFSFYEATHIENAKKALIANSKDKFEIIVDRPPYQDWQELARVCGMEAKIKDSKEYEGIQLADVICGCIRDYVNGDNNVKDIYDECFKVHMRNMKDENIPNPNLIFYKDFNDEERRRLNIFR